jgi:hypothetical protein
MRIHVHHIATGKGRTMHAEHLPAWVERVDTTSTRIYNGLQASALLAALEDGDTEQVEEFSDAIGVILWVLPAGGHSTTLPADWKTSRPVSLVKAIRPPSVDRDALTHAWWDIRMGNDVERVRGLLWAAANNRLDAFRTLVAH